jgi:hypothetical protein
MPKYKPVKIEQGWITGNDGKGGLPYWAAYGDTQWGRRQRLLNGTYWLIRRLKGEPTGPEFTVR